MRHRAVRVWWRPWHRRCACGCQWYPCPDAVGYPYPPVARSLGLAPNDGHGRPTGDDGRSGNAGPAWDGPTVRMPNAGPLMTRGARWRSNQRPR